jgi:hypothetical protein
MLPWLFGILVLLNAVLFYGGYQREVAREPVAPPVSEAVETIRLMSEVRAEAEGPGGQDVDALKQPPAVSAGRRGAATRAEQPDSVLQALSPE